MDQTSRLNRIIPLIFFLIYVSIPTKNYYWDGISFSLSIENAQHWTELFHPNHLVYNIVGWAAYHLLGGSVRALYVLQAANAFFGALTVYTLAGTLAAITRSQSATLLLSAAFGLSGTFWRFATDADAYILSVLLLCICARLLLLKSEPHPLVVAFVHAGAMLIHELAVLFVPAVFYLLWKKQTATGMRRFRTPVLYCGVAGTGTLASYIAAFRLQNGAWSFGSFTSWVASHAGDVAFSFQLFRDLRISLVSWAQLFVVGRPSIVHYAHPLTIFLLAALAVVLVLLVAGIVKRPGGPIGVRDNSGVPLNRLPTRHFGLIWLAAYAIFLVFWLPNNTFYKLFPLPAVMIFLATYWRPHTEISWRSPLVMVVALVGLFNLTFGIIPYSEDDANAAVAFALRLREPLRGNVVVYFKSLGSDDNLVKYFSPSALWKPVTTTSAIDADLDSGRAVWLETSAIETYAAHDSAWLTQRLLGAERHELVNAKHNIRFVRLVKP